MKTSDYEFHIGDEVITIHGERGKITDICHCERCRERGFFELTWEDEYGDVNYITDYDAKHEFEHYYKIGNYRFKPFVKENVKTSINTYEALVIRLKNRLAFMDEVESMNA